MLWASFDVYCRGSRIFSVGWGYNKNGNYVYYDLGRLNPSNGSISWDVFGGPVVFQDPSPYLLKSGATFESATIDSAGRPWIVVASSTGLLNALNKPNVTNRMEVDELVNGTWIDRFNAEIANASSGRSGYNEVLITPLLNGKVAIFRINPNNINQFILDTWTGSSWIEATLNDSAGTKAVGGTAVGQAITSVNDTVLFADSDYVDSPHSIRFASIAYGSGWSPISTLKTFSTSVYPEVGISSDGLSKVLLVYDTGKTLFGLGGPNGTVAYCKSADGGNSWDSCRGIVANVSVPVRDGTDGFGLKIGPLIQSGGIGTTWLSTMTGSAYTLWYDRLTQSNWTITTPTPLTTSTFTIQITTSTTTVPSTTTATIQQPNQTAGGGVPGTVSNIIKAVIKFFSDLLKWL